MFNGIILWLLDFESCGWTCTLSLCGLDSFHSEHQVHQAKIETITIRKKKPERKISITVSRQLQTHFLLLLLNSSLQ